MLKALVWSSLFLDKNNYYIILCQQKNQKQDAGSLAPIKKKTPKKLSSKNEEVIKVDLSDKKT
jgi:hypothetical protein